MYKYKESKARNIFNTDGVEGLTFYLNTLTQEELDKLDGENIADIASNLAIDLALNPVKEGLRGYDHSKDGIEESCGLEGGVLGEKISDIFSDIVSGSGGIKPSYLVERLEQNLNTRELAVLAGQYTMYKIEKAEEYAEKLKPLMDLFKRLGGDFGEGNSEEE